MKFKKDKILLFISVIISFLLGSFFWGYINLKFTDPGIRGIYSDNQFNAYNEILRYAIFISLPTFTYLICKFFFEKNYFGKIKFFFMTKEENFSKKVSYLNIYFSIIVLIVLLEFLSVNFPDHLIDIYHEGQKLSSAYKSFLDGSLWSGSYITVGIFYETLSSKIVWQLFDHISIGLTRFAEVFYILVLKINLIVLAYLVTKYTSLKPISANLFFIINSIFLVGLTDYNIASIDLITYREIPIIFLTILFLTANLLKSNFIVLILISSMSILSMFWGIDRGLVCNFLIILILMNFFLQKDFKKFLNILFFIFLFWISFYLFNKAEFFYFLENTTLVLNDFGYTYGIIHPIPFSDETNSARATKTLFLIILSLILSLSLIFSKKKYYSLQLKRIFLFLAILGTVSYLYALVRSDGPHMKQIFGYQIIFFSFFILNTLLNKFSIKIRPSIPVITILATIMISFFLNIIKPNEILSFKKRFINYLNKPDSYFLSEKDNLLINELKSHSYLDNCFDLFTYDASILYLIRKKSCTKYYFVNSLGSEINQKKYIEEIKTKTKYIITNGKTDDWDPIQKKYPIVYSFILTNFDLYKDGQYKIMKIKN
tara:strand:- start:3125 stop:4924 length:1800 start_codon:yes stop_codon:yes gene_type:complete